MNLARVVRRLLALLACAWVLGAHAAGMQVVELARAELATARGTEAVSLPHVLAAGQFDARGQAVRYRLTLDLPDVPAEPLGIYIEKASLAAGLRVNGHDLGSCGPGPLSQLRCLFQPLYFTAGPSLWRAGANELEVTVWASDRQLNGLSPLQVGPAQAVFDDFYAPRRFLVNDLIVALQWATLAMGLVALVICMGSRERSLYLWFGLACVLRALSNVNTLMVNTWGDLAWTHWFVVSVRLMLGPMTVLAMVAFFERRMPRLERAVLAYALAMPVAVALTGNDTQVGRLLALPVLVLVAGLIPRAVAWAHASRRPGEIVLAASAVALLGAGIHDIIQLRSPAAFLRTPLIPYNNAILLLVLGGLLTARLTRALHTSENLNRILAERVALHEADLQRKHQTIVELERVQARGQERERLMRDLHDGLGSSLATARLRLEDEALPPAQLRRLLDECIDDMRLLLDTSAPDASLADALGNLRYRLEHRLAGSPVSLSWRIGLDGKPALPAATRLQLMRLLQEALSNALRHAQATRIGVSAWYDRQARQLRLEVQDDGVGFDPAALAEGRGRGLDNMRYRARQAGATLAIDSGSHGTRVRLDLPLPA